jgi:protein CpxP
MNTNKDNNTRRAARSGRRWLIAAVLAVAAGAAGASFATGNPHQRGHHGPAALMAMDPAAMDAHIAQVVEQFATGTSADQKTRLTMIARAAMADVRPDYAGLRDGHARAHALLMAPALDRGALELLRAEQMQRFDAISRRVLAATEDAADVLTPAQRAAFADHLRAHMH